MRPYNIKILLLITVKPNRNTFKLISDAIESHSITNALCMRCNSVDAKYLVSVHAGRVTVCASCIAFLKVQKEKDMQKLNLKVVVKKKKKRKKDARPFSGGGANGTGLRSR